MGVFEFDERRHEPGSKQVMGVTIHENGEKEGLQVLHMLATSPATAKFISTKLAVRFVSDTPPPALVDRMAASFVASDGDIKTVLRTMFDVAGVLVAGGLPGEGEDAAGVCGVGGAGERCGGERMRMPLVQSLDKLGMPLYGMQTPNGYSWMAEQWVSTGDLVSRMNFALVLSGDRLPGVRTDWPRLLGSGQCD